MKYHVLARRYRPQTFADVVGQQAIITTLKNALRLNKAAHAYLFCGSRGVGKTTIVRLFAKALNCQSLTSDYEPCNQCKSCQEILAGQSLDVIEIDGASNRGIDDIRHINETIGCVPSHGKYRIYIIDEVHMLTKEAFNALLKTLEEPPERAKFFFATTEPHKVLPTIVSRCQRFDLQRLTEPEITKKLISIASDLQRDLSPDAAHLISLFAEGSLRDAESLLDQIFCFTDGAVRAEQVQDILGMVPDDLLFAFDAAFHEGRTAYAFELVDRLFQMGKDPCHFLEQLIHHYRYLAWIRTPDTVALSLPEPLSKRLHAAAAFYTSSQLYHILETLLNAHAPLHKSSVQRINLESLLLTVLRSKNRIPVEILVRRLNELEQKLAQAPPSKETIKDSPVDCSSTAPIFESSQEEVTQATSVCSSIELKAVPFHPIPAVSAAEPSSELITPAAAVPFHSTPTVSATEPPLDPAAPATAIAVQKPTALNEPPSIHCNMKDCSQHSPDGSTSGRGLGWHETLLHFAAVELEGTIKR
jgi:DNA polymerase-3 subunit gamma/tau